MVAEIARYRIQHTTRYDYGRSVVASFNEARLSPLQTLWQIRLESSIAIDPVAWNHRYTDYWGSDVRAFETSGPHRSLEVRASSLVEVDASRRPAAPDDLDWATVRDSTVGDEFAEYLVQSPLTAPAPELADLAASIAADNPPAQTARLIAATVHDELTPTSGTTSVTARAAQAWDARIGVCQDYAHVLIGALRHVGMPARFVSGYRYPSDEPRLGESVPGECHAWLQCWHGEWTPLDPTTMSEVSERHIMLGTGRDYDDVPPVKGILAGPAASAPQPDVTVDLTRLA